ncbi:D6 protein kinase like 2 [Hibiscus syriacus]|uniref:D6 protein kinase like 2 n=1 Tax=Hibiscus syriacus TaxID=106335 RepID=A0A6A3BG99_HIBSY|nr:D6 protein kinase like 2 [Hibiscus syriacus]
MSTPRSEAAANTYGLSSEIEEISSVFSFDVNSVGARDEDSVYVAVGKSQSSMDALSWTLSHFVDSSTNATTLFLVHVFPEIHYIPSPLGKLPKSQVSAAQVETYMTQERGKRRQFLQKYLDICTASKVKVDTMLVESDMVAKAIIDLIPILNITKLVVGTSLGEAVGIAHQIFESAPKTCEVKVVCEGKDVTANMLGSPLPSPSPLPPDLLSPAANEDYFKVSQEADDDRSDDSFACMCFKPKF